MKRTRIRARSKKRERLMRGERGRLNDELAAGDVLCELGPRIGQVVWDERREVYRGCLGIARCWHELRKRAQVGSITDRANLMAACFLCNGWVEDNPELAHRAGLVLWAGDEVS